MKYYLLDCNNWKLNYKLKDDGKNRAGLLFSKLASLIKKIYNMKKQCFFTQHNVKYIDYKDVELLKKFINPHGRILSKKRSGTASGHQRSLAEAVKRARFMGLLPYVSR